MLKLALKIVDLDAFSASHSHLFRAIDHLNLVDLHVFS